MADCPPPLVEELVPAPDPAESCERLAGLPYRLFLDSASTRTPLGRYSYVAADPAVVVRSKGLVTERLDIAAGTVERVPGDALDALGALLGGETTNPVPGLPPFQGGAAGYIAYDWGSVLERLPAPRHDDLALADVVVGVYDWVIAWDHHRDAAWIVSLGLPASGQEGERRARERMELVAERVALSSRANAREDIATTTEDMRIMRTSRLALTAMVALAPQPEHRR